MTRSGHRPGGLPSASRRAWLAALSAGLLLPAGRGWAAAPQAEGEDWWLSCRRRDRDDEVVLCDAHGQAALTVTLPERGHSFAIDTARQRAVVFGRQPGFFALAFDLHNGLGAARQRLDPPEDRHFFGHGVYTPDGRWLLATENDFAQGRAVIGVYDASPGGAYRRLGEWPTAGIGAHEAVLLPDGHTLCVANGGLLTHPDYDKRPLNLADMQPSLVYLDLRHGDVVEQVQLPAQWHQVSIRHLVVAGNGDVWFGCQHMGPAEEQPPLVGRHRRGQVPEMLTGAAGTLPLLRNYVGSMSTDAAGAVIASSSPVGGRTVFWDAASGAELGQVVLPDGCGVAGRQAPGEFLLTSGHGEMVTTAPVSARAGVVWTPVADAPADVAWDNHLRRIAT